MNHLLIITCSSMLLINLIFFILFEREKPGPEDILPMVVICCGAALGRVVFAVIPQVQPVTALVIIMGSVYGCRKGYMTGALCALVSNLFLGQGPWTLFQMTAWGIVGLGAGLLAKCPGMLKERAGTYLYAGYGVFSGFLFSIITDLLTVSYLGDNISISSAFAVFATGIAFNMGHAVFNGVLIFFFYELLSRKLYRIKMKKNS